MLTPDFLQLVGPVAHYVVSIAHYEGVELVIRSEAVGNPGCSQPGGARARLPKRQVERKPLTRNLRCHISRTTCLPRPTLQGAQVCSLQRVAPTLSPS